MMPPTCSCSFPSSLMVRIVGHGTAATEVLWHSTMNAGADSRGVNAGRMSVRVVVCPSCGAAISAPTITMAPSLMSTWTPV